MGGLACLISRRSQRLGDFAANTIVVRSQQILAPDVEQIMAGKFNSFREYPHREARLRQRVSPPEAGIGLQAMLRRDQFDARARVELFEQIAGRFRSLVELPQEASEGLTDEQWVRNAVEILFRSQSPSRQSNFRATNAPSYSK